MKSRKEGDAVKSAVLWKAHPGKVKVRAVAAHLRDTAAHGRQDAALVRDVASRIRADAAMVRDDAARTRDDAARVRDSAARMRDRAAMARDLSTKLRAQALTKRLTMTSSNGNEVWKESLALEQTASDHAREATERDRDAAELDRTAAERDRDAAERDGTAATRDREAAEKDREASEKDREASDADRQAAEPDREESERELKFAHERLTKADRLANLGALVSGVAHELNNPLAALMATLSSMKQEFTGLPQSMMTLMADAHLAAERIASVVSDMTTWVHDGENKPARQVVNFEKLIDDTLRLTRANVEAVARLTVDVQPTREVWGVAGRLSQVITNLLVNATRAIEGPRESNEIAIKVYGRPSTAIVEVTDSGKGIPPDVLPYVFDPFFTTHEGSGGMGLGLAMSERIAIDHGGKLTVETKVGSGTTFRLELAYGNDNTVKLNEPEAKEGSGLVRTRPHLLLIDDDPAFTRSLARLLSNRCEVTVAHDGAEGLAHILANDSTWDIILCDLMMPVMNGVELYRRLHESAPVIAAELVFITGGATTKETAQFLGSLPNVQLQKPFNAERLFKLIDERMGATEVKVST
jgi:C4-dicarboxylate-specific signal transduction histidine kinase